MAEPAAIGPSEDRASLFQKELEAAIKHYRTLAKRTYRLNLVINSLTLLTSLLAGGLGLAGVVNQQYVGALALLPGFFSTFSVTMSLQEKANQYYRRKDALQLIRNRLLFELPGPPTSSDIAKLSESWGALTTQMNEDWEKSIRTSHIGERTNRKAPGT